MDASTVFTALGPVASVTAVTGWVVVGVRAFLMSKKRITRRDALVVGALVDRTMGFTAVAFAAYFLNSGRDFLGVASVVAGAAIWMLGTPFPEPESDGSPGVAEG